MATEPAQRPGATLLKPHHNSQNFRPMSGSFDSSTFHLPQQQLQPTQTAGSRHPLLQPLDHQREGERSYSEGVERAASVGLPDSLFSGSYVASTVSEADSAEFNNYSLEWNSASMSPPPGAFGNAQQHTHSPALPGRVAPASSQQQANPQTRAFHSPTPEGFSSPPMNMATSRTPPLPVIIGQAGPNAGFAAPQQRHSTSTATATATAAHNSYRVASPALSVSRHQQQTQQATRGHATFMGSQSPTPTPSMSAQKVQQQGPTPTGTPTPGGPQAASGLAPHVQKLRERLPWFGLGKADSITKTVVILRGIPGTGKSSFANSLRYFYEDPTTRHVAPVTPVICSADHFFTDSSSGVYKFDKTRLGDAHRASRSRFMLGLREQLPLLVIDNTNCAKWEYQQYIDWSREAGYQVVLVEFVCREEDVAWRCQQRARFPVPMPVVRAMMRRWEHDERAILLPPAGLEVANGSVGPMAGSTQQQPVQQSAPQQQQQQQPVMVQVHQQQQQQPQQHQPDLVRATIELALRHREEQLRIERQLAILRQQQQQQHLLQRQQQAQLHQQQQQQHQRLLMSSSGSAAPSALASSSNTVPMIQVSRSSPVSPHAGLMHRQQLAQQQQQSSGAPSVGEGSSSGAHNQGLHFTFPVRGAVDSSIWRN